MTIPTEPIGSIPRPGELVEAIATRGMSDPSLDALYEAATFSGNVTLALATSPSGAVLGGPTSIVAAAGVASLTGLTINLSGSGYTLQATVANLTSGESPPFNVVTSAPQTQVRATHVFYNQSKFDGNSSGVNASDDLAIAPDKFAYRPGSGAATWSNMTSYSRGINGIMVDLDGSHGSLSAADFVFKVGTNNTPSAWANAPAPASIAVRAGAGISGSDRVEIVWTAAAAPKNTWLEVVVRGNDAAGGFNTNTGLAASDIFFFGNKVGEAGAGTASLAQTTIVDVNSTRNNTGINSTITNAFDFDRSGSVTITDVNIVRTNTGNLAKINISSPPAAPEAVATMAADGSESVVASALAAVQLPLTAPLPRVRIASRIAATEAALAPVARLVPQLIDQSGRAIKAITAIDDLFADLTDLDDELLELLI